MMSKQLELFSVDDMYGCIGVEDEFEATSVAAYLWAIRLVSELDDEKYRKVKKECDTVKIGEEEYYVPSVPGSMDIYKLDALRDCLNMREHAIIGEKYVHHYPEAYCRPHVSNPYAFVMARKAFQNYYSKEFQENGWWITNMNMRLLTKLDLYEEQLKNERYRYARFPWPKNAYNDD
jgi:hypothetical protein